MVDFELLERDGLARLGRFTTPHGAIATPALLPVVHPDPARQPIRPSELAQRFGFRAMITSAYIAWRTPGLKERALAEGIHGLLGFDGPIMTDSGAFQQHAYGEVEVRPEEILDFQERIGSDIATVLDRFGEPGMDREESALAVRTTLDRARSARAARRGLLAVPVQGGSFPDLRRDSAAEASEIADVLAVGGVVPLFEQYRFAELARSLAAARPALAPQLPVHLFGTGHPMTFAFAALFGVDLFDSSAYHKFARRGRLLLPVGSVAIDELREPICRCALCEEVPLLEVARRPKEERERRLAAHNLLTTAEEVARVRQAIRDGTLWELAEQRATAHPALRAGLAEARAHPEIFEPTEPASRRAFRETGPWSFERPAVVVFRRRLAEYVARRPPARPAPRGALSPEFLRRFPLRTATGSPVRWEVESPFGAVPLELLELYPVGPCLSVEQFGLPSAEAPTDSPPERPDAADAAADRIGPWTALEVHARLGWQFGEEIAGALEAEGLEGERSRRTGRLRSIAHRGAAWFQVGNDGLPRPTFLGGAALRSLVAPPALRVGVGSDAIEFVREGRSLFSRFVDSADPRLRIGDGALLVGADDELLAVGRLLLAPHEMRRLSRGVAVRVTAHARRPQPEDEPEPSTA